MTLGRWARPLWYGAIAAGLLLWLAYLATVREAGIDAHAYFAVDPANPYTAPEGAVDAFVYSPAFAQAVAPLHALGEAGFSTFWRGLEVAALFVMAGPLAGVLLFVQPFAPEILAGNIHLLLGLAIVAGFRWPATWSFVLLTKVTPGVGLLWFLVRREWRHLAIALGATAAIAAVSFDIAPAVWPAWVVYLSRQSAPEVATVITAPLWLRICAAAALVTWGALTDRRWTVLVASFVAMPVVWFNSGAMLVGLVALRRGVPALAAERGEPVEVGEEPRRDGLGAPRRDGVLADPRTV